MVEGARTGGKKGYVAVSFHAKRMLNIDVLPNLQGAKQAFVCYNSRQ
jgi:hypothetical protein